MIEKGVLKKISHCLCLPILLLLTSCASYKLRSDNFKSSIDAGYYSAEIEIGEAKFFGLAVASANETFKFSVTGIHNGSIVVKSPECNFFDSKAYTNFSKVSFEMKIKPKTRCLVSIFVAPYFTQKEAGTTAWRGVSGAILVRSGEKSYASDTYQITKNEDVWLRVAVLHDKTRFFLKGCGQLIDESLNHGVQSIHIEFDYWNQNTLCVMDGFLKSSEQNTALDFLVSRYDSSFMPLSCLKIESTDKGLKVDADHSVSLLGFEENETEFDNHAIFHLAGHDGVVRQYTNRGRYAFSEYRIGRGVKCFH